MIEMIPIKLNAVDAFYEKYYTEADDAQDDLPKNTRRIVTGNSRTGGTNSLNGKENPEISDATLDDGDDIDIPDDEPEDDNPMLDSEGADPNATGGGETTGDDGSDGGSDPNAGSDNGGDDSGPMLDNEGADPNTDNTGGGDTDDGPMLDDEGADPNADAPATGDGAGGPQDPNSQDDDAIHKQMLFRRFMDLHESIEGFIKRLEESLNQDIDVNKNYSSVADKLKQLNEFIYDYMVVKFKTASYAKSMLFYQRSLATAHLAIAVLGDEIEKFNKDTKNNKESKKQGKRKQNK